LKNRWRIIVLVLAAMASTLAGVTMAQPANAADIIGFSNAETGLCAEPAGVGNGALVRQVPCVDGSAAQLWQRIEVSGGFYNLVNLAQPGMCMDVRDGVNPVQIWSCGTSRTMRWSFERVFLPFDKIKSQRPGGCLDYVGTVINVQSCVNNDASQVWQIR
jgi:hypothetical protein